MTTIVRNPLSSEQQQLILEILSPFQPAVVYLFGSFGTSSQHPGSDIDLAFLPHSPMDPFARFESTNRLANALGREVDLVDLSTASTVLAKEVIREGMYLQVADPRQCATFEMRTLSDYARLNEERRPVLAALAS